MTSPPLISVIIPSYNHGHLLPTAIKSVIAQTYPDVEVVVVDDGSTDNTAELSHSYANVCFYRQENQGLSAARNRGVLLSKGDYLVFLDADDWLYPKALEINLSYFGERADLACVSGAYDNVFIEENKIEEVKNVVDSDHYSNLLKKNYIGMIAAAMFRRFVFKECRYDTKLKACEDYDLYLNVARKYSIIHHNEKIAQYRIYSSNMSSNIPLMLHSVKKVLKRQDKHLSSAAERDALRTGILMWENYYSGILYQKILSGKGYPLLLKNLACLLKCKPYLGLKLIFSKLKEFFFDEKRLSEK